MRKFKNLLFSSFFLINSFFNKVFVKSANAQTTFHFPLAGDVRPPIPPTNWTLIIAIILGVLFVFIFLIVLLEKTIKKKTKRKKKK